MKKTSLLLLTAGAVFALASCSGKPGSSVPASSSESPASSASSGATSSSSVAPLSSSEENKLAGIEDFCAYFETADNYTLQYDENNYGVKTKVVPGALMNYYPDEAIEDYGLANGGYFLVDGKGIYSMEEDGGGLASSYIYTINDSIEPSSFIVGPSFFFECGDDAWKDTADKNVFVSKNNKLKTLAAEYVGWTGYEDYISASGVKLTFDDVDDIKTAKLELTIDLTEEFEDPTSLYDCCIILSDLGSTSIAGLDELVANPGLHDGLPSAWDDATKEMMESILGEVLPTSDWSYASYAFIDSYDEFVISDLKGAGKGAAYGEKLKAAGWEYSEADSTASEDPDMPYSYDYYVKYFEPSETSDGGYYLLEIDDVSAAAYADSGDDYAALYPEGSLQIVGYRVDYTAYSAFQAFFTETEFYSGATIVAPNFNEDPTRIVFSDQSFIGWYYYGLSSWYVFRGQFTSLEVSKENLSAWANQICASEDWTLNDSDWDAGNLYCCYKMYTSEEDGEDYCELQLTIVVDAVNETGAFMIDIEE